MGAYTRKITKMFSARLKELREAHGHTLESLAELLEVSKQQVWRWEMGKNDPSATAVSNICKHFGVTADYLLGHVDQPHQMLAEEDLSPSERKVLMAMRAGLTLEAIQAVIANSKQPAKT